MRLLELREPLRIVTGFDRPNLYFDVRRERGKLSWLEDYLSTHRDKSGIVYCATRKTVEQVCANLQAVGFAATRYHAGLDDAERRQNQDDFAYDRATVMVATNAFGMGIDKSNVAFVVHYNMPKNMESYYQEAGRAGRDGEPAECILLYSGQDVRINTFLIEKSFEDNTSFDEETAETLKRNELELLKQMTFYSTSRDCYRRAMLKYFGERPTFDNCGNCSNCTQSHTDFESKDITVEAQKILSCIKRMKEMHTKWVIIDILRGTDNNRVELCGGNRQSTFGIMKENSSREIEKMIDSMIGDKYINEAPDGILSWGSAARGVIYSGMRVTMKTQSSNSIRKQIADEKQIGANANPELLNRLRELRRKVAELNGVPAFVIFSDATLRDMAEKMPTNEAQFGKVYGVGRVKTEKFGRKFMDEIEQFLSESGVPKSAEPEEEKPKKQRRAKRERPEGAANKPNLHLEKDSDGNYILPSDADGDIFAALRTLRADLSSDFGIQSNSLASTDALAQLSVDKPVTLAELRQLGILPPRTVEYGGGAIVRTIRAVLEKKGAAVSVVCDCEIHPDEELLAELKALCKQISQKIYTANNRIISDTTLETMSEVKPLNRSQLLEKIHLGNSKCLVFGKVFADAVRNYVGETDLPDGFEGVPAIDGALFLALAELRHRYAMRENKFDTAVMSDYTLYDICTKLPRTDEDFRKVYGIGEFKANKYAADVLGCIAQYFSSLQNKGE